MAPCMRLRVCTATGAVECSPYWIRSEEHTSELQSRENLVCRLLLEKKKKKTHKGAYVRQNDIDIKHTRWVFRRPTSLHIASDNSLRLINRYHSPLLSLPTTARRRPH